MLSYEIAQALRPRGPARRHHPHPLRRLRRAELRRVPRARRHARADRRHQRLLRQGALRRAHLGAALAQVPRRADREHHHRQRRALRRDRRRSVLPRRRRRALRGAQFRRARGGRGRRRPRLRVHDRRHWWWCSARPDATSPPACRAASPTCSTSTASSPGAATRRWSISSRCCPTPRTTPALRRLIENHRALHRLRSARREVPRAVGAVTAARFVKVFPKEYRRALASSRRRPGQRRSLGNKVEK